MLERHATSERLNEIVNHSSIYPWIKGQHTGPLDLTNFVANPNNVCLVGEHGSVIFQKHQPGVYEFHTCVFPEGRGQWMLDGARCAFRWMFTKTDAFELMTKCPDGNLASKAGARAVGCIQSFRTGPVWPTENGLIPVDVWTMVIQHWVKNTPELAEIGKIFHDKLHEKYEKMGKTEPLHDEDDMHNRHVGAIAEMILNGQVNKAVLFYNRWAVMSGYQSISIASYEPVIDIFESKLRVRDGDFEIV